MARIITWGDAIPLIGFDSTEMLAVRQQSLVWQPLGKWMGFVRSLGWSIHSAKHKQVSIPGTSDRCHCGEANFSKKSAQAFLISRSRESACARCTFIRAGAWPCVKTVRGLLWLRAWPGRRLHAPCDKVCRHNTQAHFHEKCQKQDRKDRAFLRIRLRYRSRV